MIEPVFIALGVALVGALLIVLALTRHALWPVSQQIELSVSVRIVLGVLGAVLLAYALALPFIVGESDGQIETVSQTTSSSSAVEATTQDSNSDPEQDSVTAEPLSTTRSTTTLAPAPPSTSARISVSSDVAEGDFYQDGAELVVTVYTAVDAVFGHAFIDVDSSSETGSDVRSGADILLEESALYDWRAEPCDGFWCWEPRTIDLVFERGAATDNNDRHTWRVPIDEVAPCDQEITLIVGASGPDLSGEVVTSNGGQSDPLLVVCS